MNLIVKEFLDTTEKMHPGHFATLLGERPAGSKWGQEITRGDIINAPWKRLPLDQTAAHVSFCDYYRLDADDMREHFPQAKQCAFPSDHPMFEPGDIAARQGAHGWELFQPKAADFRMWAAKEAWLIVGPASRADGSSVPNRLMVWTLFPGPIMPPLPEGFDGDVGALDLSVGYAVKGV
jgi:hypothetical protein